MKDNVVKELDTIIDESTNGNFDIDQDLLKQKLLIYLTGRDFVLWEHAHKQATEQAQTNNEKYWADRILSGKNKDKEFYALAMLQSASKRLRKNIK